MVLSLSVFENIAPKGVIEPKQEQVTEEWRKQHSEALHNFIPSEILIESLQHVGSNWQGMCPTWEITDFNGEVERNGSASKT